MAMANLVSNPQRLELILNFLPANEAFGAAKVSQTFHQAQERLNAGVFLQRIRPNTWASKNKLDQEFNRRLLRDWYLCLKDSALQVAYIESRQHLIFIEPSCTLTAAPQGSDPFPVDADSQKYRCSIESFNLDCLWWDCLQEELFEWPRQRSDGEEEDEEPASGPQAAPEATGGYPSDSKPEAVQEELPFELEAVPGYQGSLDPPNLLEDVLAVLSLNAAWFSYSFWTRQLQAILLLQDGRFLLIGACEMQGTIDSQAAARVYRGFVADSLASLVTFAQDPRSREILRTRLPGEPAPVASAGVQSVNPTWMSVSIPRVEPDKAEAFHERFGSFLHASETCENVLFSTLQVDVEQGRKNIKAGDKCRVVRQSETFIWTSCRCQDWAAPLGPVPPKLEAEYLERASKEDLRFTTFSGGCHLGLRRDRWYDAVVVHVNEDNTVDLRYTDPKTWSNGASGFTEGEGNDRNEALIEADVDIERVKVVPGSRWYLDFKRIWEGCSGFSCIGLSFGGDDVGSIRCFAGSQTLNQDAPKVVEEVPFLKLADVFADTTAAHLFRCKVLSEEKECFEDKESIQEIEELSLDKGQTDGEMYPRSAQMAVGKRLFLKLLRTSFWDKWVAQGGESPAKIVNLFKKDKFVRLVIK